MRPSPLTAIPAGVLPAALAGLLLVIAGAACGCAPAGKGWSALHATADAGDLARAAALLNRNPALAHARDAGDHTALHVAALRASPEMVAVLLRGGADIAARDSCGWTPLHMAAYRDRADIARLLLREGADARARDYRDQTPLDLARKYRHATVAALLAQHDDPPSSTTGHNHGAPTP
jgi:ankyrin repeat protein